MTLRPATASALLALLIYAPSALALDTARPEVRQFIADVTSKHDLKRRDVEQLLAGAETREDILNLISRPAERVRPWFQYRDNFLTEERVKAGVDFWVAHRDKLAAVEAETGVEARIIIGILGVETYFGRITGRHRVIDALATLAFDYPPRSPFFRSELEHFLLLAREEAVDTNAAVGSYAGAMGAPQFMPSSYRAYARDGDGDGKRDLWGSWDDVVASVGNYLARHGWQRGEPIVRPAELWYPSAEGLTVGSININDTVEGLAGKGVLFEAPDDGATPAVFIGVTGEDGPEYRVGFRNFSVITRYNRSVMYALAVHDLGTAIQSRLPPQ